MRSFVRGSALFIVTGVLSGCGSSTGTTPDSQTAAPATVAAATNACDMHFGGAKVLRLTTTANFKCTAEEGSLQITGPQRAVNVWLVRDAQTVDAAIGQVPRQIVSEFKDFKADQTTDLTIAGAPAKRLTGTGHEADDNDAGVADVIVFKVGDHVFVACTHGEGLSAIDHQGILTLVQTAQVP